MSKGSANPSRKTDWASRAVEVSVNATRMIHAHLTLRKVAHLAGTE